MLVVNDFILKKEHNRPSALICTHRGHRQGRFAKGLNFGSLRYQARALALFIAAKLTEKTEAWDTKAQKAKVKSTYTKNEYLLAMLRVAQQQAAYRYLLDRQLVCLAREPERRSRPGPPRRHGAQILPHGRSERG